MAGQTIKIIQKGKFSKFEKWCNKLLGHNYYNVLEKYGRMGVSALSAATPQDTGKTSESWDFVITESDGHITVSWTNDNINDGAPIAILLQYGHATRNGGYVEGIDYINPAMRPVFENMARAMWEELKH